MGSFRSIPGWSTHISVPHLAHLNSATVMRGLTVVTFLAQTMAEIVAGSIVAEQVFAVPGLGRMLVASISNRDYPVVQAIIVLMAFWVVLVNFLADLINQRLDSRLRLQ